MFRYLLLLTALLCFTQDTFAQKIDTLRRRDPDGWEFIQLVRGNMVVSERNLHHGILEGNWIEYWENKLPHTIVAYRNGKKNGISIDIRKTGQVELTESYSNDKLDGPTRRYNPGIGIAEEAYYSSGELSGSYTKWYNNNGPMQEQSNYNHNLRDGKTTYYRENGQKLAEYSYTLGKLDGDVTLYGENGRVTEFGNYSNDEQVGLWKEYHPNGKLKAEGRYVDGEKTGIWKQYDENEKELPSITYKKAKAKK
jgi:antitoxin component YwqK of YwqJK toxin-antitoxin module